MNTWLRFCTILLAGCGLWLAGLAMPAPSGHASVVAKAADMLIAPAWAHDDEHEADKKDEDKKDDDEKEHHDHHDKKDHDKDEHDD